MRCPMRSMTISAALAGAVFLSGPSLRPLTAADELPVGGRGAPTEGNDEPREADADDGNPMLRPPTAQPRLRATTLRSSRDEHLVRGAAGPVHRGKRRMPYETVIEEAGKDPRLAAYRERRKASEPTVSGQWALAEWCRRQRLTDQEQAHLTAVIALDPGHGPAHRRLGHVLVAGVWIDASGDDVSGARRSAAMRQKHAATLDSLARQIGDGTVDPDSVTTRVKDLGGRVGIGALESHLSLANEPAAMSVVRALEDDRSEEAAASLVRHALSSAWPAVRREACAALVARDRGDYVPLLIDAFDAPWMSRIEWRQGPDGTITCRQIGFREGAEERQLAVHDHRIVPVGLPDEALVLGTRQAAGLALEHDARKEAANERITMANQAVASLLRGTTGETMGDDPDQWRRWWSSQTGSSRSGEKPLRYAYRSSGSTAEGVRPPPTRVRYECLAGGTPVWTETGPVPVDRIQPGDVVLTQNPRTGTLGLEPVLQATMRPPEKVLAIRIDGETIRATSGHPFWVVGKGWTLARHLEPGNRLHGLDGGGLVERIDEETAPVRTFNLVVGDDHTYFCGMSRVMSRDNTDGKIDRSSGGASE